MQPNSWSIRCIFDQKLFCGSTFDCISTATYNNSELERLWKSQRFYCFSITSISCCSYDMDDHSCCVWKWCSNDHFFGFANCAWRKNMQLLNYFQAIRFFLSESPIRISSPKNSSLLPPPPENLFERLKTTIENGLPSNVTTTGYPGKYKNCVNYIVCSLCSFFNFPIFELTSIFLNGGCD